MELTRKSEYAIAVLVELASCGSEQPIQSREVAARRVIPENLVPQIVAMLSRQGWVEGTRGVGGGVRLVADPARISLLDVIQLVEGPLRINRCLQSGVCSRENNCTLRPVWTKAQAALTEAFRQTSIADLVEPPPAL